MKGVFVKRGGVLVADDQQAVDCLSKVRDGQEVMADVTMSRHIINHRRFFAFLQAVFDMQEHYTSIEHLRKWLIMKAGYYDKIVAKNGTVIFVPQSINWASMDEIKFKETFSKCIDVVLHEFDLDKDALDRVINFS